MSKSACISQELRENHVSSHSQPSDGANHANILTPSPQICETINFCWLSTRFCGILLQQTWQANTVGNH